MTQGSDAKAERNKEFRQAVRERIANIKRQGGAGIGSPLGMAEDFEADFGDIHVETRKDVCWGEIVAAGLDRGPFFDLN